MQEINVLEMIRVDFLLELGDFVSDVIDVGVVNRVYLIDQGRSNNLFIVLFHLLELF